MGMSTQFIVYARAGRSVRFIGDYDAVFQIVVRADAGELAQIAATLPPAATALSARTGIEAGLADKLAAPIELDVRRDGWLGLRATLRNLWGIDLADAPIAVRTGHKYDLNVDSPATELIERLTERVDADPELAQHRDASAYLIEHDDAGKEIDRRPQLCMTGGYAALDRLIDAAADEFCDAIDATPARWLHPRQRTTRLFAQGNSGYPPVPAPHVPIKASNWHLRETAARWPLLPAGDPGMAAWPDHEIRITYPTIDVPFTGAYAGLLEIARVVAGRGDQLRTPEELDREQDLLSQIDYHDHELLRSYLVEPEHGVGWALSVMLALDPAGVGRGAPTRHAFYLCVSNTLPVPAGATTAEMAKLPWVFSAEDGAESRELNLLDAVRYPRHYWRHGTINLRFVSTPVAPKLLTPSSMVWEPRKLVLRPDTAKQAAELALTNLRDQIERRLGDSPNPWQVTDPIERFRLGAQAAIWESLVISDSSWSYDGTAFDFQVVFRTPSDEVEVVSLHEPVLVPDGASPILLAAEHQSRFINDAGSKIIERLEQRWGLRSE